MGVDYGYGDKKPSPFGKKPRGYINRDDGMFPRRNTKPPKPGKSGGKSVIGDSGFFKPRKPPVKVAPGKAPGKKNPIKRSGRGL